MLQGTKAKAIQSVKVAAGSLADQFNHFVYQTNCVIGREIQVGIDQANHKYLTGDYIVQAYATYLDHSEEVIPVGTYRLEAQRKTYQTLYL
ncbi:GBS Bsp-like repeat-containing protein [Streptococcus canis]|uniref:GBS Bsp-like repeat-containing protein n=1 Tax=Streptococcus canis TaxID=1329 RepID=UPI002F3F310E